LLHGSGEGQQGNCKEHFEIMSPSFFQREINLSGAFFIHSSQKIKNNSENGTVATLSG